MFVGLERVRRDKAISPDSSEKKVGDDLNNAKIGKLLSSQYFNSAENTYIARVYKTTPVNK